MRRAQRLLQPALGRSQLLGRTLPTLLARAHAAHEDSRDTTDEDENEHADAFGGRQPEQALPEHESVVDVEECQANGESNREIVPEQRGEEDRKDEYAGGQIEAPILRVLEDNRGHEHARGGNRERSEDAADGEAAPHAVSATPPRDAGSASPSCLCSVRTGTLQAGVTPSRPRCRLSCVRCGPRHAQKDFDRSVGPDDHARSVDPLMVEQQSGTGTLDVTHRDVHAVQLLDVVVVEPDGAVLGRETHEPERDRDTGELVGLWRVDEHMDGSDVCAAA